VSHPRLVGQDFDTFIGNARLSGEFPGALAMQLEELNRLLRTGIHPKVVSEMLGQTTIGVTLELYSLVVPKTQGEAAAAKDESPHEQTITRWCQSSLEYMTATGRFRRPRG
jgi:hypothetical protein